MSIRWIYIKTFIKLIHAANMHCNVIWNVRQNAIQKINVIKMCTKAKTWSPLEYRFYQQPINHRPSFSAANQRRGYARGTAAKTLMFYLKKIHSALYLWAQTVVAVDTRQICALKKVDSSRQVISSSFSSRVYLGRVACSWFFEYNIITGLWRFVWQVFRGGVLPSWLVSTSCWYLVYNVL